MIGDAGLAGLATRGWVGDGIAGAVVGPDGTIEWFSSAGLEADADLFSLLDPAGGAIRVGPAGNRRSRRPSPEQDPHPSGSGVRYRSGTMITDLELPGATGRVRVTDSLPWAGPNQRPPGRLVRLVTALAGPLEVEVEVRPGWRFRTDRKVSAFGEGLAWDGLILRTGFPLETTAGDGAGPVWRGVRRLEPGEAFVLTLEAVEGEGHSPLSADATRTAIEDCAAAWRSWVFPLRLGGPYREAAERAALLLRSLSGTGAPLAAGTTSLPRRPGSERSEDERVVRWRDAAAAAATFAAVGLAEDAEAAEAWLRHAATDTDLPWPPVLRSDGEPTPEEDEELSLAGWRHGQPVLIGGSVGRRRDLDVYGDLAAAVSAGTSGDDLPEPGWGADPWRARPSRPGPLSAVPGALAGAADWVSDHWKDPDAGVWSLAGPPRRLVASRLQAWYALERTARLARARNPLDLAAAGWSGTAREVLAWVEREGLAGDGGLRLDDRPDDHADAALLRAAWRSPWPPQHPIVTRTVDRVLERLGHGALVYRHSPEIDDGRAGPDSPDLLASLWAVRALSALGRWEEAHERMEQICALPGPSGIFTTAADPVSGELFGNLPAAGVHLAVIDAAVALERGPR
jgi:alpha,alpha-trehalase